jgi:hypothetical protein
LSDNAQPGQPSQRKRRRLFATMVGAVFLPTLAVALLPTADAEETIEVAGAPVETPTTAPPTTRVTTTSSSTITQAPTTTAEPTTTTTEREPETTTTTRPPAPAAPPTTASPPPPPAGTGPTPTAEEAEVLACLRQRESGGDYTLVSSNGQWYGAYQFARSTWDMTARDAGRPDLVGVAPNQAAPSDQDAMALSLLRAQGKAPWNGAC